ncbi:MAG: WbqC family protein [Bacteroidota bacterium]
MAKTCAIHQPNFLPWLGYFYKIAKSDVFVILDTVDIEIGTSKAITNRTKIKAQTGDIWITIPIKKGESKLIKDIEIVNSNWKEKMLKTIFHEYRKAINFNEMYPIIEQIIQFDNYLLSEFNSNAIKSISSYLNFNTQIHLASSLPVYTEDRNLRIIEICEYLGCNTYFSGKGGAKYHDEQLFNNHEITINYTDYIQPTFNQLHGEFISGLSIIDYLFVRNSADKIW